MALVTFASYTFLKDFKYLEVAI